ncbi:unnamed protein product [Closterium sp. Naga37s-1]|nr:unnamed protein product [Closterium sp. Naga37s-1]
MYIYPLSPPVSLLYIPLPSCPIDSSSLFHLPPYRLPSSTSFLLYLSPPVTHIPTPLLPVPQSEAPSSPHADAHNASSPPLSHLPLSTLIAITSSLLSHLSLTYHLNHPHSSPLSDTLCPDLLLSPPLLPSSLPSATATIPSLLHSLRSSVPLPSLRQIYSIPLLPPPPSPPPASPTPLSSPSFRSHHSLHLLLALRATKNKQPGNISSAPSAASASAASVRDDGNLDSSSGGDEMGRACSWKHKECCNGRHSSVNSIRRKHSSGKFSNGRDMRVGGALGLAGSCTVELLDLQKGIGGLVKQEAVLAASLPIPAASASLHTSLRLGSSFPLSLPSALLSSHSPGFSSFDPSLCSPPSPSSASPASSPSVTASAITTLSFDLPSPLRNLLLPHASHPLLRPLNLPSLHAHAFVATVRGEDMGGVGGKQQIEFVKMRSRGAASDFVSQLIEGIQCSAGVGLVCPTSFGRVEVNYSWPLCMNLGESFVKRGLQVRFNSSAA